VCGAHAFKRPQCSRSCCSRYAAPNSAWFEAEHLYIQLELCAGGALGGRAAAGVPLPEADVCDVLRCIASALAHLHARGIAHLDVKPDNIFAAGDGRYALGDLGSAAALRGGDDAPAEGDARYVSSELLNGCFGALDRADVFALGASGYELARGAPLPREGGEYASLRQGKLCLLPGVSAPLQALLARCMHAYPAQRPAAEAVAASPALKPKATRAAAGAAGAGASGAGVATASQEGDAMAA
jgi:wee1-like protein kinase